MAGDGGGPGGGGGRAAGGGPPGPPGVGGGGGVAGDRAGWLGGWCGSRLACQLGVGQLGAGMQGTQRLGGPGGCRGGDP